MKLNRTLNFVGMLSLMLLVACAHERTETDGLEAAVSENSNETVRMEAAPLEESDALNSVAPDSQTTDVAALTEQIEDSVAPETPRGPASSDVTVNRFYFLRDHETPGSVAIKIFGTRSRQSSLVAWNGPAATWQAGKKIFYVSPLNSDDSEMRSFYEERGIQPELYTIQEGDDLASIARTKLGNPDCWKEIAELNNLGVDEALTVGTSIRIYPFEKPSMVTTPKHKATKKVSAGEPSPKPQPAGAPHAPTVHDIDGRQAALNLLNQPAATVTAKQVDAFADVAKKLAEVKAQKEKESAARFASAEISNFFLRFWPMAIIAVAGVLLYLGYRTRQKRFNWPAE